jgi:hypothetical protein
VFCGETDPLLDPTRLTNDFPKLHIIANAGHDPAGLLAAAAQKEIVYHEI